LLLEHDVTDWRVSAAPPAGSVLHVLGWRGAVDELPAGQGRHAVDRHAVALGEVLVALTPLLVDGPDKLGGLGV